MNHFETLLQISAIRSGVIALAVVLSRAIGHRWAARYKRLIWLALALRLLIPMNVTLPQAPITVELPNLNAPAYSLQWERPAVPASNQTAMKMDDDKPAPIQEPNQRTLTALEIALAVHSIRAGWCGVVAKL